MHNDFFNLLKKDHEEVMGMLDQIKEMSDREYKSRESMLMKVKEELVPHLRAEENAFYTVLRKNEESKEDAMEAMEEHHAAELVFTELEKMSPQEEFWPAKLSVFRELVSHHIEEEEGNIFKVAQKVIPEDMMEQIKDDFEKDKEKVKGKMAARSSSR